MSETLNTLPLHLKEIKDQVDIELYCQQKGEPPSNDALAPEKYAYMAYQLNKYLEFKFIGQNLFEQFTEDACDWTLETWKGIHKNIVQFMRKTLVANGVYIGGTPGWPRPIYERLYTLAQLEEYQEWNQPMVDNINKVFGLSEAWKDHILATETFKKSLYKHIMEAKSAKAWSERASSIPPPEHAPSVKSHPQPKSEENPPQKDVVTPNPNTPNSDSQPAVKTQNSEISTNPNLAPEPQQSFNMLSLSDVQRLIDSNNEQQRNIWQSNSPGNLVLDILPSEIKQMFNGEIPTNPWPPSTPLEPSNNYTRQLVNMSKLYSNHENKWSGKLFDTLGQKLRIFHDNARKVGLPESQFRNAISSMLKDKTWDYFFDKISAKNYNFDQIIWLLRQQFETE